MVSFHAPGAQILVEQGGIVVVPGPERGGDAVKQGGHGFVFVHDPEITSLLIDELHRADGEQVPDVVVHECDLIHHAGGGQAEGLGADRPGGQRIEPGGEFPEAGLGPSCPGRQRIDLVELVAAGEVPDAVQAGLWIGTQQGVLLPVDAGETLHVIHDVPLEAAALGAVGIRPFPGGPGEGVQVGGRRQMALCAKSCGGPVDRSQVRRQATGGGESAFPFRQPGRVEVAFP